MIRVRIDTQNTSEKWWENGGLDLWEKYLSLKDKYGDLNMSKTTALKFYHEASAIEGWNDPDAPPYAPFPLTFWNREGHEVFYDVTDFVTG